VSHFSLIVALPPGSNVQEELEERLAPYDENVESEPYRDYEDCTAEDWWWYRSLTKDAELVANNDHSGILPYYPDQTFSSSASSNKTPEQQWADIVRDAEVYNSLPNPVTWEALVVAHNRYYCEGEPYTGSSLYFHEEETDRAYQMSTYNKDSKWDYWRIGGRWGRYFPVRKPLSSEWLDGLIRTDLSWEWRDAPANEVPSPHNVDGGPKSLIDLEKLRNTKVAEAAKDYDDFWEFAKDYPKAQSWMELADTTDPITDPIERRAAIDRQRTVYRTQPLVEAMNQHEKYRRFWDSPLDTYKGDRTEYLEKVRRDAVPGYALLTLDREWVAAGEMGWFGMGSDDADSTKVYKEFANNYIDNLADDVILVVLDLHI
jgi:hypothetical protein